MDEVRAIWEENFILEKDELGNKGYHLCNMFRHGITVPPAIVISTKVCKNYYDNGKNLSESSREDILQKLALLEDFTGKKLGDVHNPLIVSVRSGAAVSMPGMLDTILNVGLTSEILRAKKSSYLYKAYLNFLDQYAQAVFHITLEESLDKEQEYSADEYEQTIEKKKAQIQRETGKSVDDVKELLIEAVQAVFDSWDKQEVEEYRKLKNIKENLYTAAVIQEMVFGNKSKSSGSGVVFTANPITGADELYGEYIVEGQGVDVVNGVAFTYEIGELEEDNRQVYEQLMSEIDKIKKVYSVPQDIEFTFEDSKLYILQTRNACIRKGGK